MNAAYGKLVQHLDEREVRYPANDESRSICADFQGEVGTCRIIAAVDEDGDLFQVLAFSPVRAPEGSRPSIAEAIAHANYGLKLGKFETDWEDGELRFQVGQVLIGAVLDDALLERMFGTATAVLDCYLPAFLSVIYGNELPEGRHPQRGDTRCVRGGMSRPGARSVLGLRDCRWAVVGVLD